MRVYTLRVMPPVGALVLSRDDYIGNITGYVTDNGVPCVTADWPAVEQLFPDPVPIDGLTLCKEERGKPRWRSVMSLTGSLGPRYGFWSCTAPRSMPGPHPWPR